MCGMFPCDRPSVPPVLHSLATPGKPVSQRNQNSDNPRHLARSNSRDRQAHHSPLPPTPPPDRPSNKAARNPRKATPQPEPPPVASSPAPRETTPSTPVPPAPTTAPGCPKPARFAKPIDKTDDKVLRQTETAPSRPSHTPSRQSPAATSDQSDRSCLQQHIPTIPPGPSHAPNTPALKAQAAKPSVCPQATQPHPHNKTRPTLPDDAAPPSP